MPGIPGPDGWPIGGNLYAIRRDLLGLLERSHAEYGDLFRLRVGCVRVLVLGGPALARHVLVDRRDIYAKTSRSSLEIRHIAGASLLVANGEDWQRKRRLVSPAFTPRAVEHYHAAMERATDAMLERWRRHLPDGGVLNLAHEMTHLTFCIVAEALLGEDLAQAAAAVDGAMNAMLAHVTARLESLPPPMSWSTPANRRFHADRARLHALVDRVIAKRRADPRDPGDLLDGMIRVAAEQGGPLDGAWLRDEVTTLLLAGHETTANALGWTWQLLAQHSDAQARILADLDEAPGTAPADRDVLRQALFESMRLYPPIWLIERRAEADDELGGHAIRAGTTVAIAIWLLHRHPSHWHDPLRFDPGRFADAGPHARVGDHYVPFGLGPRVCLGMNFAMHEALIVLARCLAHVRVETIANAAPVVPAPGITLRPRGGLPLRIVWRR